MPLEKLSLSCWKSFSKERSSEGSSCWPKASRQAFCMADVADADAACP